MSNVHKFIKGILCTLVVTSTATAVMAEDSVLVTAKAHSSATERHDRGRYLIKITGCNDCHTPGYAEAGGKIPEKDWLTGDSMGWRGPWGTTYASNLRQYMQLLSEDQWVKTAHTAHGSVSSTHAMVCPSRHDRAGSACHLSVHQEYGSCWRTGTCLPSN
jgi:hypothetical protein